jgi:hypothetical protein
MRLATRRLLEMLAEGGASSAPVVLIPTRVASGVGTLADADGGAPIAPVGDAWPDLGVEDWVAANDTLGTPAAYDAIADGPIGTPVGLPSVARKSGFPATSASDYVDFAAGELHPTSGDVTIVCRTVTPNTTVQRALLEHVTDGILIKRSSTAWLLDSWAAGVRTGARITVLGAVVGATVYIVAVAGASGLRLRLYDDTGSLVGSGTNGATVTFGSARLGNAGASGFGPWLADISWLSVHNSALTDAAIDALVAASVAASGAPPSSGPNRALTGLVSGIVDPGDATRLIVQGTGSPGDITAQGAP